ncbi:MAG: ATP synthase F1 subunit epsilon [Mariprofundus sp.]|nr:ATP synthase F1 subunit epsilon [Mariprofundus sp.]
MRPAMNILIATPEREIYRGQASLLVAPSVEGELAIMPGHAPLLARLRPGEVRIECHADNDSDCHAVDVVVLGGFLEVQPDAVIILADAVVRAEDIDVRQVQQAVDQAKRLLASADKQIASKALLDLEIAIAKLHVVRRNRRQVLI